MVSALQKEKPDLCICSKWNLNTYSTNSYVSIGCLMMTMSEKGSRNFYAILYKYVSWLSLRPHTYLIHWTIDEVRMLRSLSLSLSLSYAIWARAHWLESWGLSRIEHRKLKTYWISFDLRTWGSKQTWEIFFWWLPDDPSLRNSLASYSSRNGLYFEWNKPNCPCTIFFTWGRLHVRKIELL